MSDGTLVQKKNEPSYDQWKERGRISLKMVLLLGFTGIFTSGLLLSYVYHRTGKPGLLVLFPLVTCAVLARSDPIYLLVGIAIYLVAWIYIYTVAKKYHAAYTAEQTVAPLA